MATEDLTAHFKAIQTAVEEEEFEDVIEAADIILKSTKDQDALKSKVIALISLNRNEDALKAIQNTRGKDIDLSLEEMYLHYRLGNYEKCENILGKVPVENRENAEFQEMAAQLYYKMGKFDKASDLYKQIDSSESPDEHRLTANIIASFIAIGDNNAALKYRTKNTKDVGIWEIGFNVACALIEVEKHEEARNLLEELMGIAENLLKAEGSSPEEIEQDQANIKLQIMYLSQLKSAVDCEKTMEEYQRMKESFENANMQAVASHNTVTLREETEKLFDSIKRLDLIQHDQYKLNDKQKNIVLLNRAILDMHKKKFEDAESKTEEFAKRIGKKNLDKWPQYTLLKINTLLARKEFKECETFIQKKIDSASQEEKKELTLILAQVLLNQGDLQGGKKVIERLEQIDRSTYTSPIVMNTLMQVYQELNESEAILNIIDYALKESNDKTQFKDVLIVIGDSYSKEGDHDRAAKAYQTVLDKIDSKDELALVSLINTYALTDPEKCQEMLKKIPSSTQTFSSRELEDLESNVFAATSKKAAAGGDLSPRGDKEATETAAAQEKHKRKRKPKYPKGFDPKNPGPKPDPERWLPKYERSKYRKYAKKKGLLRGPQGGTNVSATATQDNFADSGPSTINMETAASSSKASKSRKGKRR